MENKIYQKNIADKDFHELETVIGNIVKLVIIDNVLWVGTSVTTHPWNISSLIYKRETTIITK